MRPRAYHPSWALVLHEDGSYDVMRANRPFLTGLSSRSAALQHIVQRHQPGERIFEVDTDGYRTERTREMIRQKLVMPLERAAKVIGAGTPPGRHKQVRKTDPPDRSASPDELLPPVSRSSLTRWSKKRVFTQ